MLLSSLVQPLWGQSSGANSKSKRQTLFQDGGPPLFKIWLEQDVAWIITPEEKAAFKALQNEEQRDDFVEAFWQRRDPTPDTYENEFKEEHYRRIAYANEHFGASDPGWKTDRGRIYVVYGPPDHVTAYSAQDAHPQAQDGQNYAGLSIETWSYRYLEGVGMDVMIDFVDICGCGDYKMRMPDDLPDAVLITPSGLTGVRPRTTEPSDLKLYVKPMDDRKGKFPQLEQMLHSKAPPRAIPVEVSTDAIKATDITSIVQVVISFNKGEIAPQEKEASRAQTLNVLGRFISLTGRIVDEFEDVLTVDPAGPSEARLLKGIPLFNAHYRLEIAVENAKTEKATTWIGVLNVRP